MGRRPGPGRVRRRHQSEISQLGDSEAGLAQSGVSGAEENHAVDRDLGGTPEQGKMGPAGFGRLVMHAEKGLLCEGEGSRSRMVNRHDEVRDIVPRQRYAEARVVHRRDQCTETCGDQGGRRQRGTN